MQKLQLYIDVTNDDTNAYTYILFDAQGWLDERRPVLNSKL